MYVNRWYWQKIVCYWVLVMVSFSGGGDNRRIRLWHEYISHSLDHIYSDVAMTINCAVAHYKMRNTYNCGTLYYLYAIQYLNILRIYVLEVLDMAGKRIKYHIPNMHLFPPPPPPPPPLPLDKMAAICSLQAVFLDAFSWKKRFVFWYFD